MQPLAGTLNRINVPRKSDTARFFSKNATFDEPGRSRCPIAFRQFYQKNFTDAPSKENISAKTDSASQDRPSLHAEQNPDRLPVPNPRPLFRRLLSASLKQTTLLLLIVWFVNALIYYGLVLLTTELQSKHNQKCDGDHFDLEKDQYFEIFVDTIAEFVGFGFAYFAIDSLGRRKSLAVFMSVSGMALWPLVFSENDVYQTVFLFVGRASIVGSFNVIYVYTPELFPTDVRAFGLGICTALSRLGGLVAPLFAVQMVDQGLSTIVELLFSVFCLIGALASSRIPIETKGRELQDKVEVELANVQSTARIPSDEEIQPL